MRRFGTFLPFLTLTVLLGILLRWEFVYGWLANAGIQFAHVRHAHSHTGYYGVLVLPLVWAFEREGLNLSRRLLAVYMLSAFAAGILFVFLGYGVATIILSTIVLTGWVTLAVSRLRQGGPAGSWLDAAPWGLLLGSVFIPPVAITARSNPALSATLAHLFLSILLLGAFLPAAWALTGLQRKQPVMVWIGLAVGASFAFSFPGELGLAAGVLLLAFAGALFWNTRGILNSPWLRSYWQGLALAIGASALAPQLQTDAARIAGIHFIVLGPLLGSFAAAFLPALRKIPQWMLLNYHLALGGMLGAIVLGTEFWPVQASFTTAAVSTWFVASMAFCVIAAIWRPADLQ